MMRFVDLTEEYWLDGGPHQYAFIDTVYDRFVVAPDGTHLFDQADFAELPARLKELVPAGYFDDQPWDAINKFLDAGQSEAAINALITCYSRSTERFVYALRSPASRTTMKRLRPFIAAKWADPAQIAKLNEIIIIDENT